MKLKIITSIFAMLTSWVSAYSKQVAQVEHPRWINWGGNQLCFPKKIFYPAQQEDLISIVQEARSKKRTIAAYGSGHSWSSIVCADYLVNTDKLNRILSINKELMQVTVEAGIKVSDLNKKLAEAGLALPNLGATAASSIAGMTATATHGTGHTGTTASFIIALELIDAQGTIHQLSPEKTPEEFAAARTSIGALGLIYSITLQCVPLFKLSYVRITSTWEETLKQYQQLYTDNDYFMFSWNPYTNKVLQTIWNKTNNESESTTTKGMFLAALDKLFLGLWTGAFWVKLLEWFPSWTPMFTNSLYAMAQVNALVDYSYKLLATTHDVIYQEEEIAIPAEYIIPAAREVKELIDRHRTTKDFYIFMWGVLFRFVKADTNNYLSPATGRDTVYISITSSRINEEFYREFQQRMLKYHGRPHWGKINFIDYTLAHTLYGENLDKFIAVRNKLDREGIFANNFVRQVLTPAHT